MKRRKSSIVPTTVSVAFAFTITASAMAQVPPPAPEPAYAAQKPPPRHPMRDLFVGTVAALMQGVSTAVVSTVSQGVAGSITAWFSRRQRAQPNSAYPDPAIAAYAGNGAYQAPYPSPASQPAYVPPPAPLPAPAQAVAIAATESKLVYAGIAYEVHALNAAGSGMPIDPATFDFHTGDHFVVHLRPSMPGRLQVYNVNPLGRESLIQNATLSAAQLTSLGPYEFTSNAGEERLRLLMLPCSSPQLVAQTRDIVNVANTVASDSPAAVVLAGCDDPATRSLQRARPRDITRVEVDGSTTYALDAVSPAEAASAVQPRELTIVFRHASR